MPDTATRIREPQYEKCAECHLFVEPNGSDGGDVAEYVHLTRGDSADDALDYSHTARPSGAIAPLDYWREHGPAAMRARFDIR